MGQDFIGAVCTCATARELRDRYLEQINHDASPLISGGKYDVNRLMDLSETHGTRATTRVVESIVVTPSPRAALPSPMAA
jgi:hypothetical protein